MDTERRLNKLKKDLEPYLVMMDKASDELINQEITKYPIYIIHDQEINLGIPLVEAEKNKASFSINVSTLEEFATKNVIKKERVENFIEIYKNADDYFCLFIIDHLGSKFAFTPRD